MRYPSSYLPALLLLATSPQALACTGYSVCPTVNYPKVLASPAARTLDADIDATEQAAEQSLSANNVNFGQLVTYLGEALVFDRTLSANKTQACASCHAPNFGFGGGLPALTFHGGTFPGADPFRTGNRAPPSMAYAAFAAPLAYDSNRNTFFGGTFRDSRATGLVTGSPVGDQAAFPLTGAAEMGLADQACAVRRVQLAPYGATFQKVWGANTFNIKWPANVDSVCAGFNNSAATAPTPLALSTADRAQAITSFQDIGQTIATFEASPMVSPFSSKFDAILAGQAQFTPLEKLGAGLFVGAGQCSGCHDVSGAKPLFTNYGSTNIGVPRNPGLPFLTENAADFRGYVANPAGPGYIDPGLGGYLASAADTNPQWQAQAQRFMGAFQIPTLRNVAAGSRRSYMHNGFFTDLKMVVHFYNTRTVLPQCSGTSQIGVGVTCWPAPENPNNVDADIGHLGLTDQQETAIVAFLKTLTDGYTPPPALVGSAASP